MVPLVLRHRNECGPKVASSFPPPVAGIPQPFPDAAVKVANKDRPASINFALHGNLEQRDRDFPEVTAPKILVTFPVPV